MDGILPESLHGQFLDHGCRSGIELLQPTDIVEHEGGDLY